MVQKSVRKTGEFGIGMMIHSVHMTDDVPALNRFYEEVFGGLLYMGVDEPGFLPVEDRWAGLLLVSDLPGVIVTGKLAEGEQRRDLWITTDH